MSAVPQPDYAEYIENGGEPIRPGFYRTRRSGDAGWVEIEIKPDPTGKGEFVAVDGAGRAVNAETVWTRCVSNPSTREAFAATKQQTNHTTETPTMEPASLAIEQSDRAGKLYAALAKAQAEIKRAKKDSANPHFKSKYADLASVADACMEALAKNGIAVLQLPTTTGENIAVTTRFGIDTPEGGEWIQSTIAVKPQKFDAQGAGSVITYLRRYGLAAMAGVAPEDDDGEGAVGRGAQPSGETMRPAPAPKAETKPVETDAQKIARFWAGQDFKVPKLRLSWQDWQAKMISAISSAPDAAALGQLMADNAYELDGLKAEVPKAHAVLSAAAAARFPKGK